MGAVFDRFISKANFTGAWQRVRRKNSCGGLDNVTIEQFARHADQRLDRVRRAIEQGHYVPRPVRSVHIPKYNETNEWRELGLPTVLDKIVQTAVVQVLEPLLEQVFRPSSFAYRPGRGQRMAIERVTSLIDDSSRPWILRQDIDNFFDSLDHRILLQQIAPHVDYDQRLLELVSLWCKNGVITGNGAWRDSVQGVRQGHVIAPILANLYLHGLDCFAEATGCRWIRYADDYLAVCKSRQQAEEVDSLVRDYLADHLGLALNPNGRPVTDLAEGFTFLGIFFNEQGRLIAPAKIKKMRKKVGWLLNGQKNADLHETFLRLRETGDGWLRYYGHIDPVQQFTEMDEFIRGQLVQALRQHLDREEWPEKPPPELPWPFIREPGQNRKQRQVMISIWREALAGRAGEALRSSSRKTDRARRAYQAGNTSGKIVVTAPGYFIGKSGKRLVVRQGRKNISETPIHLVHHLLLGCHGQSLSTDVIRFCLDNNVSIHFMDERGRIYSSMHQPGGGRLQRAVLQIERRDEPAGLDIARSIIRAKLKNQFGVLKNFAKYNGGNRTEFYASLDREKVFFKRMIKKVSLCSREKKPAEQRQHLMGIEGVFAGRYWRLFGLLLPKETEFPGRRKKGASDLVNSMLNYGYGILYATILQAIHLAGLNPECGFLHSSKNGRPALSLDLIEIFRAPVVDRTIISLLSRKTRIELTAKGLLTDESRKKTARAVLGALHRELTWKSRRVSLEVIIGEQCEHLARHLEGKEPFAPYLFKW